MTDPFGKDQNPAGSRAASSRRFLELDALRGLAVLAVILFHYSTRYDQLFGHRQQPYPLDFKYGYFGVHLFFIISGFVIFMTLEKTASIRMFAFKRFARLYPAYWFSALLTFAIITLASLPERLLSRRVLLVNLTMFQGWLNAGVMFLFTGIFHLLIRGKLGFLKHRSIVFIGTLSYSLYLVHQNLGYVLIRALENLGWTSAWTLLIPISTMILLAAGITFGIEKPAQLAAHRMITRFQSLRILHGSGR